ncbi:MAG: hypothetical protein AB7S48_07625 [Bacteroidales bacterium]
MKKITLTQNEVNDLIDLYQTEIDRAQRRIVNLKALLKQLIEGKSSSEEDGGVEKKSKEEVVSMPAKRGRKPKVQKESIVEEKVKEPKKRGRKPKVKEEKVVSKKEEDEVVKKVEKLAKKRGRKPKPVRKSIKIGKGEDKVKWIDLIYDILRTKNSLMLSNSLTLAAMEQLGISDVDKDRVRMAISTNLTRLTKYDKTIGKYSQDGTPGSFYGLADWFDSKGKPKAEFKNKLM